MVANLTIDGNSYSVLIQIVSDDLLQQKLLIGRDFIHTVDINIKRGKATASPSSETFCVNVSERPEIYQINVIENPSVNLVDVSDSQTTTIFFVEPMTHNKQKNLNVGCLRVIESYCLTHFIPHSIVCVSEVSYYCDQIEM